MDSDPGDEMIGVQWSSDGTSDVLWGDTLHVVAVEPPAISEARIAELEHRMDKAASRLNAEIACLNEMDNALMADTRKVLNRLDALADEIAVLHGADVATAPRDDDPGAAHEPADGAGEAIARAIGRGIPARRWP